MPPKKERTQFKIFEELVKSGKTKYKPEELDQLISKLEQSGHIEKGLKTDQ